MAMFFGFRFLVWMLSFFIARGLGTWWGKWGAWLVLVVLTSGASCTATDTLQSWSLLNCGADPGAVLTGQLQAWAGLFLSSQGEKSLWGSGGRMSQLPRHHRGWGDRVPEPIP